MRKKSKPLTNKAGDVRELTREDIRQMRPMSDVFPAFVARWKKDRQRRGRPAGRTKAVVSISLDKDVISSLRSSGKGWQSRLNDLLRAAIGLDAKS